MSERRACRLVELDRSSYRYEPRADHNAELREELVKLARQKPRYLVRGAQNPVDPHSAGTANAERARGEFQWTNAR